MKIPVTLKKVFSVVRTIALFIVLVAVLFRPSSSLAQVSTEQAGEQIKGETYFSQEPAPQQSTTGTMPPAAVLRQDALKVPDSEDIRLSENLLTVPAYLWRHGCGPTAVGMIVGYYDENGYPDLIPGSALTQTNEVNQAIASGGSLGSPNPAGQEKHFEDYALPRDDILPAMQTDSYITSGRTPHIDNSIADFMDTSKSTRNNRYGWSWSSDIAPAFQDYVAMMNPDYSGAVEQYYGSALTWSVLTSEIDAGRPMGFLVDTDGSGQSDHFVTVIGYRTSPRNQYAMWDTWSNTTVRWEEFRQLSAGASWGIWGGWTFRINEAIEDEYEDDDTWQQAKTITSGVPQTHSIDPASDIDWVTFTLGANSAVRLETSGSTGSDTRLWLYDSNLAQLEYDDDDGTGAYSLIDRVCGVDSLPAGTYYAKVDQNNDVDEISAYTLSYTIAQACSPSTPEMDVRDEASGVSIADGDASPSTADGTDFGSVDVISGSVSRALRIWNTGTGDLQLTGNPRVLISGSHAGDFSVFAQPDPSVGAGASSALIVVIFNPSAAGLRTADVSIANNDSNENPYNFTIQGAGTLTPPVNVQATDGAYTHQICISWDADEGIGHAISRADTLTGLKAVLNPSEFASSSFCDTTVTPGQIYYYWVQACQDQSTCSAYGTYDTGYTPFRTFLPALIR